MIGLSLAECIRDVAAGRVKVEKVEKIISCTRVPEVESWEEVIVRYRKHFWKEGKNISPDACERIFRKLLSDNKIIQPAVTEKRLPKIGGGWVNTLVGLEWNQVDTKEDLRE